MTVGDTEFKSFLRPDSDELIVPTEPPKINGTILDRFSLKNKVSVITGATGAIGGAVAEAYAQAGSDVVIMDYIHDTTLPEKLAKHYGVRSKCFQVDVSKYEQVKEVIEQIVEEFGTIDVFVANAGVIWPFGSILNEAATPEVWRRVFDVNVHGVFYCAKCVGEIFKKNNKGSFIITASMSAHICNVPNYQTCYNASKAAVMHMGKSLAVEFAGFARVNTVSPGYTNTPISDPIPKEQRAKWWSLIPLGREALPDELAGAYLYLASDVSSYTTGTDIRVDGGYCAV